MTMDHILNNLKMDVTNKVESMEELLMINPFQKRSHRVARIIASTFNLDGKIYPDKAVYYFDQTTVKVPKVIFFPSKAVMRCMIDGNLKFGKRDRLEQFLLRFGVVEDTTWHVEQYRKHMKTK